MTSGNYYLVFQKIRYNSRKYNGFEIFGQNIVLLLIIHVLLPKHI